MVFTIQWITDTAGEVFKYVSKAYNHHNADFFFQFKIIINKMSQLAFSASI